MKIITALGNPIFNEKLRALKNINVIGKDIQYQEGVLEILEENENIDIILISNLLPEEYGFTKLINKIKNVNKEIEIIVFLDNKNEDIENFLSSKNIYKIYYFNQINIDNFSSFFYSNFLLKKEDFLSRNY